MCPVVLLKKTTAAPNEVALSYHRVRGLCQYFLAVGFVATVVELLICPVYEMICPVVVGAGTSRRHEQF